jgi:hypothetical protein
VLRLAEAVQSTIPYQALNVTLENVLRHPDTRTIQLQVAVKSANLGWEPTEGGRSTTRLMVAAASLNDDRSMLASKVENLTVSAPTGDTIRSANAVTRISLVVRVPRKTRDVRVVVETVNGGRMGAADLDRKMMDAAAAAPTPNPQLIPGRQRPSEPIVQ